MSTADGTTAAGDPLRILRVEPASDVVDPDPGFAASLRRRLIVGADLPEGVIMSLADIPTPLQTEPTQTVPRPGALPYLAVDGARRAIDWYRDHLDARLLDDPVEMPDGRIGHAELAVGGGTIYLADPFPEIGMVAPTAGQSSVSLMLPVTDADAAVGRTRDGGAIVEREPADQHGARSAVVVDPFGHRWILSGPTAVGAPDPIRHGDIGFVSLQTPDPRRAIRFYSAVLGWTVDDDGMVTNVGHRIAVARRGAAGIFCAYAVDDLEAAAAAIRAAGGGAEAGTAGDGRAVVDAVDDAGNRFAVFARDPRLPRPPQHPADAGELAYLTVLTTDSARFRRFYTAVLGWRFAPGQIDDGWEADGTHPQVGVAGGADAEGQTPMWAVDDIDAAVAAVASAGGEVLDPPSRQPYGRIARCRDDQGAEFYLGQLS